MPGSRVRVPPLLCPEGAFVVGTRPLARVPPLLLSYQSLTVSTSSCFSGTLPPWHPRGPFLRISCRMLSGRLPCHAIKPAEMAVSSGHSVLWSFVLILTWRCYAHAQSRLCPSACSAPEVEGRTMRLGGRRRCGFTPT
jgi:hypothetical protein